MFKQLRDLCPMTAWRKTSLSRLYDAYINDGYLIAFCLLNNPKAKSTGVATGKEKHEPEQPNHFIKYRSNKKT